jgi:transcriptional regulator with XRE-family HTH domain
MWKNGDRGLAPWAITDLLKLRKKTQKAIAEDLKISPNVVSQVIYRKCRSQRIEWELCKILNLSLWEIFGRL